MNQKTLYEKIEDYLFRLIEDERMKNTANDFLLPSENQLCIKFKVCRATARMAIKQLVDKNIAYKIRGKGTFAHILSAENSAAVKYKNTQISLIFPSIQSDFVQQIVTNILWKLKEFNIYCSTYLSFQDNQFEEEIINYVTKSYTSGMIIYPTDNVSLRKNLSGSLLKKIPTVFIDRIPAGVDAYFVATDHFDSLYQIAGKLLDAGCKKFLYFSPSSKVSSEQERTRGLRSTFADRRLSHADCRVVPLRSLDYESARLEIKAALQSFPCDAVVIPSGVYPPALHTVMNELNLRPIRDLIVVNYDAEIPDYLNPFKNKSIEIIQNPKLIGVEAALSIVDLIQRRPTQKQKRIPASFSNLDILGSFGKSDGDGSDD